VRLWTALAAHGQLTMCHESWQPTGAAAAAEILTFTAADGAEIPAWRYRGAQAKGACLVLPDIYGPSPFYHAITARLAEQGFDAVMIDYFFREGPLAETTRAAAFGRRSTMDENRCLTDIGSVIDQLPGQQPGTRIAVIGFCLSGTYAYDLTAVRSDLATVTFYGFPEGPGGPVLDRAPRPIDIAGLFQGPILSFWGDQDNIPMELVERFGSEAARQGADYRYRIYPGAGHGFLQGLLEQRADSASAHDAWRQTVAFLNGARTLAGEA
jgi:carboxymethylenebutenolidase